MRPTIVLLPLLLILVDGVACKDDESPTAAFGEPCGQDDPGEDLPCGDGLTCDNLYCEEVCESDADCRAISGAMHVCDAGTCKIFCDADNACPTSLPVGPLQCVFETCVAS